MNFLTRLTKTEIEATLKALNENMFSFNKYALGLMVGEDKFFLMVNDARPVMYDGLMNDTMVQHIEHGFVTEVQFVSVVDGVKLDISKIEHILQYSSKSDDAELAECLWVRCPSHDYQNEPYVEYVARPIIDSQSDMRKLRYDLMTSGVPYYSIDKTLELILHNRKTIEFIYKTFR